MLPNATIQTTGPGHRRSLYAGFAAASGEGTLPLWHLDRSGTERGVLTSPADPVPRGRSVGSRP